MNHVELELLLNCLSDRLFANVEIAARKSFAERRDLAGGEIYDDIDVICESRLSVGDCRGGSGDQIR